jgi:hypothetical protein
MLPRVQPLVLVLLLAACEAKPPLSPAPDAQFSNGATALFRVESPMFPFYSRTEPPSSVGGFGYRTEEWAAVVFYRDPDCVRPDFNLFAFFDIPGAFGCTSRIDGFSLHVEPAGVTPPKLSNLHGTAVPIWFVPWDAAFQQAVNDESLTIAQLEAIPGLLKGVATQFREILQSVENHPVPKINISARGEILPEYGGGAFRYNVNWPGLTVATVKNVSIVIQ